MFKENSKPFSKINHNFFTKISKLLLNLKIFVAKKVKSILLQKKKISEKRSLVK